MSVSGQSGLFLPASQILKQIVLKRVTENKQVLRLISYYHASGEGRDRFSLQNPEVLCIPGA